MITDQQFRRLMKLSQTEETLALAAAKAGMDEKTARKWRRLGKPPSEVKQPRAYRTRPDAFAEVWEEIEQLLEGEPSLEAKTIFDHLCRKYEGRYQESQLRALQRRVKIWRALKGAPKEVFFAQEHVPGRQAQSDFTHLSELMVTIAGQVFPLQILQSTGEFLLIYAAIYQRGSRKHFARATGRQGQRDH
jgi:hypothetical protein